MITTQDRRHGVREWSLSVNAYLVVLGLTIQELQTVWRFQEIGLTSEQLLSGVKKYSNVLTITEDNENNETPLVQITSSAKVQERNTDSQQQSIQFFDSRIFYSDTSGGMAQESDSAYKRDYDATTPNTEYSDAHIYIVACISLSRIWTAPKDFVACDASTVAARLIC
jgi:hypothetical protein